MKANVASAGSLAPASERIVLAFLGGFATAPVQKLLNNLSDAIGTLLQGRETSPPPVPGAVTTPMPAQNQPQDETTQNASG